MSARPMRPMTLRERGYSACDHPRWRVEPRVISAPEPADQPPWGWGEVRVRVECLFCGAYASGPSCSWTGGSLDWVPDALWLPSSWPLTPADPPAEA